MTGTSRILEGLRWLRGLVEPREGIGCGAAPPAAAPAPAGIEIKCSKNARPGRCGAGSIAMTRAYLARLYMVSAAEPSDAAGLRVFISSTVIDLIILF